MKDIPLGLDSVGTIIPSFHRHNRSEMIGRKYNWISSGFCSLGPGRILVHMRFDVRYLENFILYVKGQCNTTYRNSGGRLQIENNVGHDKWNGVMLL